MILIISTLPHYLSALPLFDRCYDLTYQYVNTILAASTLSIIYHYCDESFIIGVIDYTAAFIWLLYDLYYAWTFDEGETFNKVVSARPPLGGGQALLTKVSSANALVLMLNWSITKSNPDYEFLHSLWHVASAAKCYYVSLLISAAIERQVRFIQP